ncbi:hypothetical protein [Polaromonas sp.]
MNASNCAWVKPYIAGVPAKRPQSLRLTSWTAMLLQQNPIRGTP